MLFSDLGGRQKEELAEWLRDIGQMRLVYRLYSSVQAFPDPKHAPNLYALLRRGLESPEMGHQVEAA